MTQTQASFPDRATGRLFSYVQDQEMFPDITIHLIREQGGQTLTRVWLEDEYGESGEKIAQDYDREDLIAAMEDHIKSCINVIAALRTLKQEPPPPELPRIIQPRRLSRIEYRDFMRAAGYPSQSSLAIGNGKALYEHQLKWKELLS